MEKKTGLQNSKSRKQIRILYKICFLDLLFCKSRKQIRILYKIYIWWYVYMYKSCRSTWFITFKPQELKREFSFSFFTQESCVRARILTRHKHNIWSGRHYVHFKKIIVVVQCCCQFDMLHIFLSKWSVESFRKNLHLRHQTASMCIVHAIFLSSYRISTIFTYYTISELKLEKNHLTQLASA